MAVLIALASALAVGLLVKVLLMVPVWLRELADEEKRAESARVAHSVGTYSGSGYRPPSVDPSSYGLEQDADSYAEGWRAAPTRDDPGMTASELAEWQTAIPPGSVRNW